MISKVLTKLASTGISGLGNFSTEVFNRHTEDEAMNFCSKNEVSWVLLEFCEKILFSLSLLTRWYVCENLFISKIANPGK